MSIPRITEILETGLPVTELPGTSEADIAAMKAKIDTLQADTALIKADIGTSQADLALIKAGIPLTAGEAHIGEVGANTILVSITPIVTAGAYHANDIVGGTGAGAGLGINTLANAVRVSGGTGIIQSLVISDLAAQNAILEVYLFSANPAAGTYTDNGVLDIHDTDALLCIGRIDVAAADYKSLADNSIACVRSIGLPIKVAGTSLFVIIRTTGTPTYVGTSDLKLTFGILRD